MRIVHAVYSLEMGGAEVVVAQLCRIQAAQGHQVTVCAYASLGAVGEALRREGFDVVVLGEASPLLTVWRYVRLLTGLAPDVVHCHNVAPTIQAAPAAWLAGVPKVLTTRHGFPLPYNVAEELKFNLAVLFCDYVVGISGKTCTDLRQAPLAAAGKVVCVYNGSSPVSMMSGLRDTEAFTLLFVGRLAPVKDLGTLLRAVNLARQEAPQLRLWIVGDGPVRTDLDALVRELQLEEHVTFWGQQMETARFFSAADAFVMSSLSEGLSMSLLQAMSAGLPSVLTDVAGNGEVLALTGAGLPVPVQEPETMAAAILKLVTDSSLRGALSQRAVAAYQERFTLESMNAAYLDLYREPEPASPAT